jgi:hypothetical protein
MIPRGGIQAALAGLHGSFERFDVASERITRTVDPGELATGIVEMNLSVHQVRANVAVVRSEDEVVESLLDLFA